MHSSPTYVEREVDGVGSRKWSGMNERVGEAPNAAVDVANWHAHHDCEREHCCWKGEEENNKVWKRSEEER